MENILNMLLTMTVGIGAFVSIFTITLLGLYIYDKISDMINRFLYYMKESHQELYRDFTKFATTIAILMFSILVICSIYFLGWVIRNKVVG